MAIPSWKLLPRSFAATHGAEASRGHSTLHLQSGAGAGRSRIAAGSAQRYFRRRSRSRCAVAHHRVVNAVSFTGSTEVGRIVSQAVAPTFKKLHLEMGGKNIIIVMDDANLDLAVEGAVWGGFGTTGQRCTAASRVARAPKVYREFSEKFVERVKKLRVGDGLHATTDMGPLVNEQQLQTTMKYVKMGADEGARMLRRPSPRQGRFGQGLVPRAHRLCRLRSADAHRQEEIFGPVVSLIRPFNTLDEAIEIANGVKYGLSASIYTRNVNSAMRARRDLETGIVYVNAPTIGAETHLPFGGTKNTGNGHREAGLAALDFYSDWKTVYIDYSDKLQRAQIDTGRLTRDVRRADIATQTFAMNQDSMSQDERMIIGVPERVEGPRELGWALRPCGREGAGARPGTRCWWRRARASCRPFIDDELPTRLAGAEIVRLRRHDVWRLRRHGREGEGAGREGVRTFFAAGPGAISPICTWRRLPVLTEQAACRRK